MQAVTLDWSYEDLTQLLAQSAWQAADQATCDVLLQAANRVQEGWLDTAAVAHLPCHLLHQLDYLWTQYSGGQFGFSVQHQIYRHAISPKALRFSHTIGWLLSDKSPLAFCKPYSRLTFDLEAPPGHLPALWYWQLPWQQSWIAGGFGVRRDFGFGDAALLDAMMLRFERCQFVA
ncbi:hputative GUN4 domain containing protein [Halomicronema hongdechloris C2206]|uniref:Hputative GUN4 domain containing protein n=1 Tax=Halomicronema hongdechloris C2206 TaxID=1641165 RepID=A0A1Z3HR26_9CYAN|nr:GUN4 domain-containing protein [Halomicronema hongdechloris]ASC72763.1 hputative GUN4 domain containing protein [Halomicronema hongdechloris C2206]